MKSYYLFDKHGLSLDRLTEGLQSGLDPNSTVDGKPLLYYALHSYDMTAMLLESGADPSSVFLHLSDMICTNGLIPNINRPFSSSLGRTCDDEDIVMKENLQILDLYLHYQIYPYQIDLLCNCVLRQDRQYFYEFIEPIIHKNKLDKTVPEAKIGTLSKL